jgi:large repetitive protein
MKVSFSHKKPILLGGGLLIVISIFILLFTTCDIGLGQIVNTKAPVIKNSGDNLPGAFLHGKENRIALDVSNELGFKIDEVFVEIEYFDLESQTIKTKTVHAEQDPATGEWFVMLDVSGMGDGKIRTWVTAIDESGNKTTSTEIPYTVKNMLPQLKLNIPQVSDDDFDSKEKLEGLLDTDIVYQGLDLMGIATDAYKIADGFPKIMFWPKDKELFEFDTDSDGIPIDNEKWGQYRTVELPLNYQGGSEVVRFTWPLADLVEDPNAPDGTGWRLPKRLPNGKYGDEFVSLPANKEYRFRIWVQDGFGNDNFYPNRIDNKRGENGTAADPDTAEIKYIPMWYQSIGDKAIVQVPDMKLFYNMAGDFVQKITVLSGNGMTTDKGTGPDPDGKVAFLEAYICENYDGSGNSWGPYYAIKGEGANSPYDYTLTIPKAIAQTWLTSGKIREGRYYLKLQATDDNGNAGAIERKYFDMDLTPPEVKFDQPGVLDNVFKTGSIVGGKYTILYPPQTSRPKWVTSTVTAGGKSTDTYGIDKVYYHVGKYTDDKMTDSQLVAFYSDDNLIVDGNPFWEDTRLGTANPAPNWGGSVYAFTYTQAYPKGYKTTHSSQVQALSDLGFTPNSSIIGNYETTGNERFYLPIYVKVVDQAGNKQIVHYKLSVDPDLDDPQITFVYPKEGDTVGGTVRMNGTAEDNIWLHSVLMRIHKDGDGNNNIDDPNYWYKPTTVPETLFFYETSASGGYPTPTTVPNPNKGWFKLTQITGEGAVVNWTSTVNGDGKLNPPAGVDTVNVTINAVAIDSGVANGSPRLIGPVETQVVQFSSKVPLIENIKINKTGVDPRDYFEGISTSGKFKMTMKVSAIDGIFKLLAKVDNNPQVTLITNNAPQSVNGAVWQVTNPTKVDDQRYESTLTITIDSTDTDAVGGIGYGITNIMNLEITVEDNTQSKFSTTRNLKVGIDNFYPTGEVETSTMAYDNIITEYDKNNKYFLVQGTAKDWGAGSGVLQGLERVLVYFEKAKIVYATPGNFNSDRTVVGNQNYIKPDGTAATGPDFAEYLDVMDTAYTGWNSTMKEPNRKTGFSMPRLVNSGTADVPKWTSPAAMVIDYAENDPTQDYDGDGTYGEKWVGVTDKIWEARMMISDRVTGTQKFADGPYIVHYVVMDTAGNATHYQKDIYVENNKPRIEKIRIGTDINFNNEVLYPAEYRDTAYIVNNTSESKGSIETPPTEFSIRNRRFGVSIEWGKGNGTKTARVFYVTRGPQISVTSMKRGRVYQIATVNQYTDFTKYGAPNGYLGTVFVASCAGEGEPDKVAKVYELVRGNDQSLTLSDTTAFQTTAHVFDNFSGITDTDEGLFIVKIYDTTVSTVSNGGTTVDPEFDQLSQAVLLTVSIKNTDSVQPKIEVANFGRRHLPSATGSAQNYGELGLSKIADAVYTDYVNTTGTTKNGYVQYQAHSTANTGAGSDNVNTDVILGYGGTAYISGKVIFNGKVNDNHLIERITVQIPNYNGGNGSGNEFNIATRNTTVGSADFGLLQPANTSAEREFRTVYPNSQVPQYSLAYGQTVVWQFMWDSSKITTLAQNNVNVTFRVYDQTNNVISIKNVNIVPYISKITTPLSKAYASNPSAFNRSAMGGYPVKEGDDIDIEGFNLGNAVGNAVINGTTNVALSTGSNNGILIKSTIPATATSGPLVVTVNSIPSFNNSTNKNKTVSYNNEPNNVNNNVLDNSRYIYVWNTGYIDNQTVANIYNPFMRIAANGTRLLSYGWYPSSGNGVLRVNRNGTNIATATANTNRMTNTTIAIPSAANNATVNNSWYAIGSDITAGNYPFRFAKSNPAGTEYQDTNNLVNPIGANSNRFKIPRIAVQSTSTGTNNRSDANSDRVLISYFDDDNKRIELIYGNVGSNGNVSNISNIAAVQVATNSTTYSGSIYTAAGFLSNGLPLIAWYDQSHDKLIFSYGNSTPTTTTVRSFQTTGNAANSGAGNSARVFTYNNHGLTTNDVVTVDGAIRYVNVLTANTFKLFSDAALTTGNPATGTNGNITVVFTPNTSYVSTIQAQWQSNAVVIDSGKGAHVDMAVDANDNVHLAYYDVNNGGLYYALIPPTPTTGAGRRPNPTSAIATPVKVDTFLSAGTKLMINVRLSNGNYVPYITYAHASFAETKNSIRVAWRTDFTTTTPLAGTDENDIFTGKWEVMTVPVSGTVIPRTDEFICNGVPTSATWTTPGGTSTLTYNTNLNQTVIVGYMTDQWYEGAILKGNILTVPGILQK